ncbi:head decoration protein [Glutamicibacter arilaitensis]|uniref:head decoration protein n=1 Tax=Glutamicibacter arilaitensis TaxID=256701 RepID=UPI003FD4A672
MDLTIKRESFGQDDQSWLGSAHGTNAAQTITLDVSTFTAEEHYPDGWLKSGLPLAKSEETYVLWTTEADLAGFLFTTVKAPADPATPVGGAILEHGRVKTAKLPVSVDTAGQATAAGRIIFA